jgi:hypothetical protein
VEDDAGAERIARGNRFMYGSARGTQRSRTTLSYTAVGGKCASACPRFGLPDLFPSRLQPFVLIP